MNNKILIADSNYLLREGLKSLFANSEYQLVGEVNSGTELFEAVSLTQPHLVIINFTSINFSVNDISKIVAANPSTQILAITERPTKQAVSKAMQAGVKSYLMIDCDHDEIMDAVKFTLEGETFLCGKIVNEVINAPIANIEEIATQSISCNGIKISPREIGIISLVAEGFTNKQIADQLFLSAHTVITHRKNIMSKLGVNNTAGLVLFAMKQNIISPNKFLFSTEN